MSDQEIIKEHSNDEITIVWKPKTCIHSERCWRGLVSVFNPKKRPWINPEGAETDAIINQVQQCPSGALSFYYNNQEEKDEEKEAVRMEVKVTSGGPLMVAGEVKIIHKDGSEELRKNAALCRCGLSANKPFCDGSHRKSDFDA